MDDTSDITILLARIAVALERIADSLDAQNPPLQEAGAEDAAAPAGSEGAQPGGNDLPLLHKFLASRNIAIKTLPAEQESDETLDKLAVMIGDKLESVSLLLDAIKANMSAGRAFSLHLKDLPQQSIADITNLSSNLYAIAFLTAYRYYKSPAYQLNATPSTAPKAQNFFSGQWLERFVKAQVISLLKSRAIKFSYLCNAQITLPNGDDFEIDMLFDAGGEIFWLEAKSGEYQKHIEKYSKMTKTMGLDRAHTFMVLTDNNVSDRVARDLSNVFGMTVVRAERLVEQLELVLSRNGKEVERYETPPETLREAVKPPAKKTSEAEAETLAPEHPAPLPIVNPATTAPGALPAHSLEEITAALSEAWASEDPTFQIEAGYNILQQAARLLARANAQDERIPFKKTLRDAAISNGAKETQIDNKIKSALIIHGLALKPGHEIEKKEAAGLLRAAEAILKMAGLGAAAEAAVHPRAESRRVQISPTEEPGATAPDVLSSETL